MQYIALELVKCIINAIVFHLNYSTINRSVAAIKDNIYKSIIPPTQNSLLNVHKNIFTFNPIVELYHTYSDFLVTQALDRASQWDSILTWGLYLIFEVFDM
ncbi:hypothetical protein NEFER03_2061 [Nematocida sp. LUAm3]|nr:hypothetical protein NEFER03_2061 [Nematocida sp. LUAm3]KAI5176221.1 hypothetical protein NEFER02_2027 [Nematocida sp. LUAm2]KAI5179209.1 hypothetical protein NEFER01_2066 [Nematocida sp. LUAm1]